MEHRFYKTGDRDVPEQILDRNGEVVLQCCKICGRAEAELATKCVGSPFAKRETSISEFGGKN